MNKKLRIGFWNTSLSPAIKDKKSIKKRKTPTNLIFAVSVIETLLVNIEIDILYLCEVDDETINNIEKNIDSNKYETIRCTDHSNPKDKRSGKFDICAIYNKNKILIKSEKPITKKNDEITFKVGYHNAVGISDVKDSFDLHIIASHWPNLGVLTSDSTERGDLAKALKDFANLTLEEDKKNYIVMLGDYNDEPFSKSMDSSLRASRDVERVQSSDFLFFNTSWQHVGMQNHFQCMVSAKSYINCGTIYKKEKQTNWKVFDQIIVSKNFLLRQCCQVPNNKSQIYCDSKLTDMLRRKSIFDHLPIWIEIGY